MRQKIVATCAVAGIAALALAGCSGSSGSPTATAAPVSTAVSGQGKTLTVWDYESNDSAMGASWNAAIAEFEKETGAKVNFQSKAFEQIQSTASQILNSDSAPDVMEYNKGNGTAGTLATQGLLTNLDSAYQTYGWANKIAPSLLTTSKYSDKGIMGSGNYYGVTNYGEYVEFYYNKAMFQKYGLTVPTTLAQLEQDMQVFVDHGITPLAEAAQEYPLGQLWYQLALSKADRTWVNAYQTYTSKVDWTGPELSYATQTLKDWESKGYISKDAAGMKAQDAGNAFEAGTSPIFYSGSWWYGTFEQQINKFDWGTFLFPQSTMAPGSSGNIWVVPTKAKEKDLAYKFIDITLQKAQQDLMGNKGGIPVAADPSAITDPKNKELIQNFTTLTGRDGIGFYPDWPTSTFYTQLNAGLQELLNGTKTPDQVNQELGSEYQAGVDQIVQQP